MAAATKARSLPPPATPHSVQPYSREYFLLCGLGGALACGPTHALMTPLDVVKCNAQTDAEHFGKGTVRGLRYILSGEAGALGFNSGLRGVFKGGVPTFVGYSFQGAGKYGSETHIHASAHYPPLRVSSHPQWLMRAGSCSV